MSNIRNFSIIAHIDHGKSTLADRMLEITGTVEKRKMQEQYLDQMPLERERGITIKMQPVRLEWRGFILNLIDTPGHIDFSYEVSRALAAVEGAVLLVDGTQGVQAQTLSVLETARALNLIIIPVVNKIDLPQARVLETKEELGAVLQCREDDILEISARTGEGVAKLLAEIIKRIPQPRSDLDGVRALIFDFEYSLHRGVIAHIRGFDGEIKKGAKLRLFQAQEDFLVGEVGYFRPELVPAEALRAGEIGYVITNIKEARKVLVGDTILNNKQQTLSPLPGYREPKPVVFSSLFPENQDKFTELKRALERLKLSDASFSFEEESSGVLGRGFRSGFLGMLHLEIVVERLRRDFGVKTMVATPTVKYKVKTKRGEFEVYSPHKFPEEAELLEVWEPWLKVEILMPLEKLSGILKLLKEHEALVGATHKFSETRLKLEAELPLRELVRDFFDELKSVSQGYASLNYEFLEMRKGDLVRLEVLVAEEMVPAFSRIVPKARVQEEAERAVEKLYKILPRALFALKIQARALGRILASRPLPALRKDVTGYLYGGDRSRKMKLWKKQKAGKKRLAESARYSIPPEVFIKMLRKSL